MSTPPRLAGKTALITGAGAGIGAATARLFCQEGASVLLVDANADALERTRAELQAAYADRWIRVMCADVTDEAQAQAAV
jgi:2-hydroxycyclohexanecarboxyl-CoA dehydrogenase